jgi:hypothetical protein
MGTSLGVTAMRTLVIFILLSLDGLVSLHAQLPPPVARGLAAAKSGDFNLAIDEWTKTWVANETTDSARTRLKNAFARLDQKSQGWELVRDLAVSSSLHRYYVIVSCERVPLYLVLEAYQRPDSQWSVNNIIFNSSLSGLAPLDAAIFLRGP